LTKKNQEQVQLFHSIEINAPKYADIIV